MPENRFAKYVTAAAPAQPENRFAKYAPEAPETQPGHGGFQGFIANRLDDATHWYKGFWQRQEDIGRLQASADPKDRAQAAQLADQNSFFDWLNHVPDVVTRPIARPWAKLYGPDSGPQYEAKVDELSGALGMAGFFAAGAGKGDPPLSAEAARGPRAGAGRFRTAEEAADQFKARGGSSTAGTDRFGPKPEPKPKAAPEAAAEPAAAAAPHKVVAGARMDAESRFETDADGHVLAESGDAHAFGDQKAAARWIIDHGQKNTADQIFQIANHPTEAGKFAVQETGRAPVSPKPLDFVSDEAAPLGEVSLTVATDPVAELHAAQDASLKAQAAARAAQEAHASAAAEAEKEGNRFADTRGQGVQYHGARGPIGDLKEGYYNPDNIYGGWETFYTTDAADVAAGYGRKNPNATIHRVTEKAPVKFYDMEEPQEQAHWDKFLGAEDDVNSPLGEAVETAASEHGGKANLRQVMDEVRAISRDYGWTKDDVQELFDGIGQRLQQAGYGGMEHQGGLKTGRKPHRVRIYLRPHEQITVEPTQPARAGLSPERQAELDALKAHADETKAAHEAAERTRREKFAARMAAGGAGGGSTPPPGSSPPPPPNGAPGASPGAAPDPLDFVQPVQKRGPIQDAKRAIDEKGLPGAVADWFAHLYTATVSEQHPLVRTVEQLRSQIEAHTGKPMDLLPSADPRKLARGGYDVFNIGHMDLMNGVHPYRGIDPASPALSDVVAAATDPHVRAGETPAQALRRFNSYLTALRGVEEWDRYGRGEIPNAPLPVSRGGDRASLVDHITRAEAANPHYAALAAATNDFGRALWTKAFDAGLIDAETYAAANQARSFYVPFRRVMDPSAAKEATGATNKASTAKKFEGSERDVLGPVEMLARQTYELNRRIRQNDINISLIKLAEKLDALIRQTDPEGENGLLRKVKRPSSRIRLTPEELKKLGIDESMFGDDANTFFRPGEINEGGRPIIYAWRDGKREAWELVDPEWGRDTFNAVTGMSREMSDLWMSALQVVSSTLRAGITTHPEFLIANLIKDQVMTWVVTDLGFVPGEGLIGTGQALVDGDLLRRYAVGGGISGGQAVAGVRDAAIHADIMALRHKGFVANYASDLEGVLKLSEVTETGTRLRVFQRAFARAQAEGLSEYDSLLEAAFAARDVLDFGRNGSRLHITRKIITFLNAGIQGLDKSLRVATASGASTRVPLRDALKPLFIERPAGMRAEDAKAMRLAYKSYGKVIAIAMFGLALAAAYRDDEEYQNISEYSRAHAWWFKLGPLGWFGVPKPFESALLSNVAERAFEGVYHNDSRAWGRLIRGVGQTLALPTDNPMQKVSVELAVNKNFDTGQPIVPAGKEGLMPEDQYAYWNSAFAKALGKAVGVSPAKVDFAISGYSGSWGRSAQWFSNLTDPDRPAMGLADAPVSRRFFHEWQRGAQDKTDFYNLVGSKTSDYAQLLGSVKERAEAGRVTEAKALVEKADPQARIYVASQLANDGHAKGLNPLTRAQVVATEVNRIIGEMYGDRPRGVAERGGERDAESALPTLNSHQKAAAQDALERLAVSEFHNAMVATGERGFENKPLMQRDHYVAELEAVSPQLAQALQRRLATGREKALDYHAVMRAWPVAAARLKRDGETADLSDLLADARIAAP